MARATRWRWPPETRTGRTGRCVGRAGRLRRKLDGLAQAADAVAAQRRMICLPSLMSGSREVAGVLEHHGICEPRAQLPLGGTDDCGRPADRAFHTRALGQQSHDRQTA